MRRCLNPPPTQKSIKESKDKIHEIYPMEVIIYTFQAEEPRLTEAKG